MELLEILKARIDVLPDLAKFAIAIAIMVGVPPIASRVRLPPAVGLLLFGVAVGPHALGIFGEHRPIADFFGELGILLLMFSAGLEIDLALFRSAQTRSIIFGILTTTMPLMFGTLLGFVFHYALVPAIVIGSLLASHTLLSLPIVTRLGVARLEPIIIAVGATVMSDTLSLIVFAICVSTYTTGFSVAGLATQIIEIVVFVPMILFGLGSGGAALMRRVQNSEEGQFLLLLGVMGVAGALAQYINLPGIVGAFLAGLAVNRAARNNPTKERLGFFGRALFIPSFFIVTGFLIDPGVFVETVVYKFPLAFGIVASLIVGKGIAAALAGRVFGYSPTAKLTIWALTLPQVAATLAAAVVAYNTRDATGQRMLDDTMLNAVLVLMLVTSILGPLLTERFAPRLLDTSARAEAMPATESSV
jgi:Kef-type K+ transport system membrane component KefB